MILILHHRNGYIQKIYNVDTYTVSADKITVYVKNNSSPIDIDRDDIVYWEEKDDIRS